MTENYSPLYEEALGLIEYFEAEGKPDKVKLMKAAAKLTDAIKTDPYHSDSYFLLAYIFYILNDDYLAEKYLKIAEELAGEQKSRYSGLRELIKS